MSVSYIQVLDQVSPKPSEVNSATASQYPDRNRNTEYLPGTYMFLTAYHSVHNYVCLLYVAHYVADRYRVLLKGEHPDYIHAAFVHVSACWFACTVGFTLAANRSRATSSRRLSLLLKDP